VTFQRLILINALIFIALGIAFCIYAPLIMALFQIAEIEEMDVLAYWNIAAFIRLSGGGIFLCGLLLWAIRSALPELSVQSIKGINFSLFIGFLVFFIVGLSQQVLVWQKIAGWILIALLFVFLSFYGFFLFQDNKEN